MIREYVNKGKTVASIAVFFALVRPDTQPPMWVMALLVIGSYEAILFGIRVDRQLRQAKRRKRNERIRREDGRRWAAEYVGWPMKEVN